MSGAVAIGLPIRPGRYSAGADLPVGTYRIVALAVGYTVCRTVGVQRWYPLTSRDNPEWLTWPSVGLCMQDVMDADFSFTCSDLPHWGGA